MLEAVVDATKRFDVRIKCTGVTEAPSLPPFCPVSILPVEVCSDLLSSAFKGLMPFRLSVSLCSVVCLLSYTAEMEQTARSCAASDQAVGRCDEDAVHIGETLSRDDKERVQCVAGCRRTDALRLEGCGAMSLEGTHQVLPVRAMKPDFFVQFDSGAWVARAPSSPCIRLTDRRIEAWLKECTSHIAIN